MRQHRCAGNETGSSLILVLVFLGAFSLLIAALLSQTDVNFKVSSAVKDHNGTVYAADSGIEYGLDQLKANAEWCPQAGTTGNLGTVNVNGTTVDVTCETQSGNGQGGFGYAIIALDPGSDAIHSDSGADKAVTGSIWNNGGWQVNQNLVVTGNVHQTAANFSGCVTGSYNGATQVGGVTVTPSPPNNWICDSAPPAPNVVLPTTVPADAPVPTKSGTCTVLHPGRYSLAGILSWASASFATPNDLFNGATYMESGIYFFDALGTIPVKGASTVVFGGKQTAGDQRALLSSDGFNPCASDPGSNADSGVLVVLGGDSTVSVQTGAQLEWFTYVPASGDVGKSMSLYQLPNSVGGAFAGKGRSILLPKTTYVLDLSGASSMKGAVHGAIYAPEGSVSAFSQNANAAVLSGGSYVWDFRMKASVAGGGGLTIASIQTTPGVRQIIIKATAKGVSGSKDIVSRAVVTIDNSVTPRQAAILSWVTDNP